jgi:hypothetical protein
MIEPLLIIVIGVALGLVDLTASEVSGMLRIPALIAALILVGQGLTLLEQARQQGTVTRVIEEREPADDIGDDPTVLPANSPRKIVIAGDDEDGESGGRAPTRAYVVLGLAIWLGIATLAYPTAPVQLILLSLLSAFLLFATAWRTLQTSSPSES